MNWTLIERIKPLVLPVSSLIFAMTTLNFGFKLRVLRKELRESRDETRSQSRILTIELEKKNQEITELRKQLTLAE